jgi:hydroxymethylpyrimidine/phosphomethylpyrimidine kinase
VTPNLDEAAVLIGQAVRDVADMERAAQLLVERGGAGAALVTGGHLPGAETVDVLFDPTLGVRQYRRARIDTVHTHGTGCTLSAAIAARLALGDQLPAAVETALAFVHRAIATAPGLGAGHGPLNHWA